MPHHRTTRVGGTGPGLARRSHALVRLALAFVLGLAGLAPAALAPAAHAVSDQDKTRAGQLIQEGLTLARNKKFREAIPKFEEALKLYPHPETRHNLGRAHEELGELKQAHEYFTQALKEDYQFAADGRQRLMRIETELRKSYARVTVRTTPSQVNVVLEFPSGETETHVTTPFQTWVPAGRTRFVGTNPAFKTAEQSFDLAAGEDREVSLVLIPLPKQGFLQVSVSQPGATISVSGRVAGKSPLAGLPWEVGVWELEVKLRGYKTYTETIVVNQDSVTSVNVNLLPDQEGGGEPESSGVAPWVGWTLVGTGVVAAGVAAYLQFGKAFPLQDEADGLEEIPENNDKYNRLHDKSLDYQLAAQITAGAAVVLVGTGIYLLVAEAPPETEGATTPRFVPSVAVTPDGGLVGGTWTF